MHHQHKIREACEFRIFLFRHPKDRSEDLQYPVRSVSLLGQSNKMHL